MKTGSFSLILITTLLTIQLVGCSTEPKIRVTNYDSANDPRTAEIKLANAADSIKKSLAELAEIERASHPQAKLSSPLDPNITGMNQLASIDWSGPIEPFVRKLAEASKYKLNVLGTPPGIPILISISVKDTLLADVLRNANFQCGNKANIVVYPASRIMELRYVKS